MSVAVAAGMRIGLVGPNGVGKTTLLRILAGEDAPDSGSVRSSPPGLKIGFLPQTPDARAGESALGYLARRTGVAAAEARLEESADALARDARLVESYTDSLETYLALGGPDLPARAAGVCADIGLASDNLDRPLAELSGGQAARVALAGVFLARFDVLLLDEPTNNLDFAGIERLERFVGELSGGLIVVSHDRAFLDRAVTSILELDEWTGGAREYAGGWSAYAAERAQERSRQYAEFGRYVDERERIQEQARQMHQWELRGYGQGRKKKKTKDIRRAYAKKLGQLAPADKPYEPWRLQLEFGSPSRSSGLAVRLQDATVERGAFRLGPLTLELGRGERVALLGANGSGKTTLLSAVLGSLPLVSGRRTVGPGVVLGTLEQSRLQFAGGPLLEGFVAQTGLPDEQARTLLAKFGLGTADVGRDGSSLSPGERTRAILALNAARGVDVLILDEPTNHLDVEAIEELESALASFAGTVLLVTHDRAFLEDFRATRTLDLTLRAGELSSGD